DLIDAHILALQYLSKGGESQIMNCGYGRGYSVLEVLDAMKRISGTPFEILTKDRRAGDTPHLVADSSKLKKLLGWTPKRDDLDLICRTSLEWEHMLAGGTKPLRWRFEKGLLHLPSPLEATI
ncbi:MAG: hypothetical protein ACKOX6_10905, partial [Bdellovibrio sp.]